jgi:molecular chaperone GrpE
MTNKHKKKQQTENTESPPQAAEPQAQEDPEMVTIPLNDYASQLEELDDLRQKADEFSDGWQRERAEFANYRKRVARDELMQKENLRIEVIRRYLDVHDDLELAIKNMPPAVRDDGWASGIELIYQKLQNILAVEDIHPIPAEKATFDPHLHEAISHEEHAGVESGYVIEVVQKGYTIGDRVIRPARVRVAK